MTISPLRPQKIAVIGSGISGLGCAWLLDQGHDVTLFEKDDRLGGHANTVTCALDGQDVPVDTGFIVYNPVNYPNLVQLFKHLNVTSAETDMTFAISRNKGQLEYSGTDMSGLLAQKKNLLRPRFWVMIKELLRFYRNAESMCQAAEAQEMTLGELLERYGYHDAFVQDHLLPMGAAIWSTPTQAMLDYPASSFLRFCINHGLVQLSDRPQWRTVVGGSRQYVNAIQEGLRGKVRLNSLIHKIKRENGKVIVQDLHGNSETFDHVVLACHPDQAIKLLDQPSAQELELLSAFPYQRNQAFLHTDCSLMPQREAVWSSWNYMATGNKQDQQVSVTYWMNKLQPLPCNTPVFVSLNPQTPPQPDTLLRTFFYDHPVFGRNALQAQKNLWKLQGQQNTWFCGAYFGYGFHEDGLQSGLAVAEQLGSIPRPWHLQNPNNRIHVNNAIHAVESLTEVCDA
ncbi:NAD(P)/FAD-dependent oxidoreductase [Pontibacter sp. JAM-7]|uniref:NAD(P)/FAD-dependent oxidoreductase n=1 Tax=Pontibacter sp. JAM-7 TaxID=3366581 RepID=UPI003AF522CD